LPAIPPKRPIRFFNTTGPCFPWDHYMLPPANNRISNKLNKYIKDKFYWILHVPRQIGKTTFLLQWVREINSDDKAVAYYISVEACHSITNIAEVNKTINKIICMASNIEIFSMQEITNTQTELLLYRTMYKWVEMIAPKPLIFFFDEIDLLNRDALINFLRQLQNRNPEREPGRFPVSIVLVTRRDIKEYITTVNNEIVHNKDYPVYIKDDTIFLSKFSKDDISSLFAQRTEETGQQITDEALDYTYKQSSGQPWVVNSLFERATMRVLKADDYSTITRGHIEKAREQIIQAEETHLINMEVCLRYPKINNIIKSILAGNNNKMSFDNSDVELAMDLGIVLFENGVLSIANPIYHEAFERLIYSR